MIRFRSWMAAAHAAAILACTLGWASTPAWAGPAGDGHGDVVIVEIRRYAFEPAEIVIRPGTTVRWINRERRQYHSVWFEESGEPEPEYFFPGESYERRFERPGRYTYRCGPHEEMRGTVRVVGD